MRALIGGQVLDIQNEGRRVTAEELDAIHMAKTGALIQCAVRVGAIDLRRCRRDELQQAARRRVALGLRVEARFLPRNREHEERVDAAWHGIALQRVAVRVRVQQLGEAARHQFGPVVVGHAVE